MGNWFSNNNHPTHFELMMDAIASNPFNPDSFKPDKDYYWISLEQLQAWFKYHPNAIPNNINRLNWAPHSTNYRYSMTSRDFTLSTMIMYQHMKLNPRFLFGSDPPYIQFTLAQIKSLKFLV